MTPLQAANLMRETADTLNLARARMSAQMRIIFGIGGEQALRNVFEAEVQSIRGANDNGGWVG